ncbi:hypothetical protein G9A89_011920 [Geosiphon pyriformis]|nr:hypothetical protein G9A89_011920 [Geosiphon pyriformis]
MFYSKEFFKSSLNESPTMSSLDKSRIGKEQDNFRNRTTVQLENIYDVVIVGGGIAGTALACALASSPKTSSQKIALIEIGDYSEFRKWKPSLDEFSNRVSSITPGSARFLKEIEVWDHLDLTRIKPYQSIHVWDGVSDGQISFSNKNDNHDNSIPYLGFTPNSQQKPEALAWIIENYNLQRGILSKLEDTFREKGDIAKRIDVFDRTRVDKISFTKNQEDDSFDLSEWPLVELDNGKSLRARLLKVGADGINSPVRIFAQIESLGWDYNSSAIVATLQVNPLVQNDTAWQRFLPTGPIAMLPLNQAGYASLVWSTSPQLSKKLCHLPSDQFIPLLNAAFRLPTQDLDYFYSQILSDLGKSISIDDEMRWREEVLNKTRNDHSYTWDQKGNGNINTDRNMNTRPPKIIGIQEDSRATFPLRMRNSERYVKERVVLVGDAAHAIHPLAGQGLNQALADVKSLLKVIETGVMNGQDIGDLRLLSEYASERYLPNLVMISAVDKLHKLFSTDFGPVVWARSVGLRAFDSVRPVKAEIMKFAMGVE